MKSHRPNNIDSVNDSELLEEYRENGDPEILGKLYNRYIHLVYGVCLKYLKNREDSKDAVIQIFESLVTEIPKYEIQHFRSWLYVVTKNHCFMHIRHATSEKKRFEKYSRDFMESTEILHPIDEERNAELEQKLKVCIEKLKEEQQACIRLFYYEKKCYEEIAQTLNIEQKKVKSFIQNGRRNLKMCLEKEMQTDEV